MMLRADLHTHTIASGHAYSTVGEMARSAAAKGLDLIIARGLRQIGRAHV